MDTYYKRFEKLNNLTYPLLTKSTDFCGSQIKYDIGLKTISLNQIDKRFRKAAKQKLLITESQKVLFTVGDSPSAKAGIKSGDTILEINTLNEQWENDDILALQEGGWEIGLHTDPQSVNDIEKIKQEKEKLESLTKKPIIGNRVHFLNYNSELPLKLKELGFVYDASLRHSKDKIDEKEMGHSKINEIIEFPVTLMDAYLFTHIIFIKFHIFWKYDIPSHIIFHKSISIYSKPFCFLFIRYLFIRV